MNRLSLLWLLPSLALAQTGTLELSDPFRGTNLPPTGAAITDQSISTEVNPAGLSSVAGLELFYVHERSVARSQVLDGLYLADTFGPLGIGFSHNWVRTTNGPAYAKTSWSFSLGSPNYALGATFNFLSSDDSPVIDRLTTFDLGIKLRPLHVLSIGFVAKNLDAPSRFGLTLNRQFDLGVGIRPIGDRYTLGVDYLLPETTPILQGRLQYTLQASLTPGIGLSAGVSHGLRAGDDLMFQIALTLDTDHLGFTYAAGGTPGGLDHIFAVRASTQKYRALSFNSGKVALVDLGERLGGGNALSDLLGLGEEDPFLSLMRFLDEASRDPELRGVVLKVDNLPEVSLAKVEELRQAIIRLRAANKRVIAIVLEAEQKEYLVASAADQVLALPATVLMVNGVHSDTIFLGAALEKLGVHVDVARVGAYKNAPDQLTRDSMSPEQKESLDALLDNAERHVELDLIQSRRLTAERARAIIVEGVFPAQRAKEVGLVDDVITPDQLEQKLQLAVPGAEYEPGYKPRGRRDERWGSLRKIAVVPVIGDIAGGKSRRDALSGASIAGAETIVRALRRAEEDSSVAAVVVRIDSHGGGIMASDLIYRAVLEAKKKKPVIASMGDVAASGGYYSAMGADEIVAEPTTITGSIGVFAIKPAVQGLADKLGVKIETLSRAPLTGITQLYRPWTPDEQKAMQSWIDKSYDGFISEVAQSRKLSKEKVDAVARGRVWSGEDAKGRGLVDSLGDLEHAIAIARTRAGIAETEPLDVVELGEPRGLLAPGGSDESVAVREWLLKAAEQLAPPGTPAPIARAARELGLSEGLFENEAKAVMPFRLVVR